jgi:predicted ATPase with chaperone activity
VGLSRSRGEVASWDFTRPLAELVGEERVGSGHLAEAVQYRVLDRDGT